MTELSICDAAQHFKVSERTIRRWIHAGKLHAEKVKGRWIVRAKVDTPFVRSVPTSADLSNRLKHADFEAQHLVELLEEKTEQIQQLRAELTEKNKQIESLTRSLDQAQQLLAIQTRNNATLTARLQVIEDMRSRPWYKRLFRR